jgi:hypothetical protein
MRRGDPKHVTRASFFPRLIVPTQSLPLECRPKTYNIYRTKLQVSCPVWGAAYNTGKAGYPYHRGQQNSLRPIA